MTGKNTLRALAPRTRSAHSLRALAPRTRSAHLLRALAPRTRSAHSLRALAPRTLSAHSLRALAIPRIFLGIYEVTYYFFRVLTGCSCCKKCTEDLMDLESDDVIISKDASQIVEKINPAFVHDDTAVVIDVDTRTQFHVDLIT
jgi:hypothetical protein